MAMQIKLEGGAALDRKLRSLPVAVAKTIMRKALRTGGKPILKAARAKVPVLTGATRRAIKLRTLRSRSRGSIAVAISVGAKDFYKGDQFYAAFLEFGHRIGKRSTSLRAYKRRTGEDPRGEVPPRPFLRPAMDENADAAVAAIGSELGALIEQEARR
jgi:HK97 gp10 family phage protein